jgi:hypothetical protein
MKQSLTTFLFLVSVLITTGQDTPETAIDISHSWSNGVFICQTMIGMTDSPTSQAEGPDVWFKTYAVANTLNSFPSIGDCNNPWIIREVFDENLVSLACNQCNNYDHCQTWDVTVGEDYYVSFTLINGLEPFDNDIAFALAVDELILQGDGDGDGLSNADDLLWFFAAFGQIGHLNQDYNMDLIVNASVPLTHLIYYGHVVDNDYCD